MKTKRYPTYYPQEYYDEGRYYYPTRKGDEDTGRVYEGNNEGSSFSDNSTQDWIYGRGEFSVHNDINWEKYVRSQEKLKKLKR